MKGIYKLGTCFKVSNSLIVETFSRIGFCWEVALLFSCAAEPTSSIGYYSSVFALSRDFRLRFDSVDLWFSSTLSFSAMVSSGIFFCTGYCFLAGDAGFDYYDFAWSL